MDFAEGFPLKGFHQGLLKPTQSTQLGRKAAFWVYQFLRIRVLLILFNKLQLPFLLFHSCVIFTEATSPHRILEMNSKAIRAPHHLPKLALSVVPAQSLVTHAQGRSLVLLLSP